MSVPRVWRIHVFELTPTILTQATPARVVKYDSTPTLPQTAASASPFFRAPSRQLINYPYDRSSPPNMTPAFLSTPRNEEIVLLTGAVDGRVPPTTHAHTRAHTPTNPHGHMPLWWHGCRRILNTPESRAVSCAEEAGRDKITA